MSSNANAQIVELNRLARSNDVRIRNRAALVRARLKGANLTELRSISGFSNAAIWKLLGNFKRKGIKAITTMGKNTNFSRFLAPKIIQLKKEGLTAKEIVKKLAKKNHKICTNTIYRVTGEKHKNKFSKKLLSVSKHPDIRIRTRAQALIDYYRDEPVGYIAKRLNKTESVVLSWVRCWEKYGLDWIKDTQGTSLVGILKEHKLLLKQLAKLPIRRFARVLMLKRIACVSTQEAAFVRRELEKRGLINVKKTRKNTRTSKIPTWVVESILRANPKRYGFKNWTISATTQVLRKQGIDISESSVQRSIENIKRSIAPIHA